MQAWSHIPPTIYAITCQGYTPKKLPWNLKLNEQFVIFQVQVISFFQQFPSSTSCHLRDFQRRSSPPGSTGCSTVNPSRPGVLPRPFRGDGLKPDISSVRKKTHAVLFLRILGFQPWNPRLVGKIHENLWLPPNITGFFFNHRFVVWGPGMRFHFWLGDSVVGYFPCPLTIAAEKNVCQKLQT